MTVHIIGGGLAGLAAALACTNAGHSVSLYEAAPHLGGRCRTYHDPVFNRALDNGTHVVMAANQSVNRYLNMIGTRASLIQAPAKRIDMFDLGNGQVRQIKPHVAALQQLGPGLRLRRAKSGQSAGDLLKAAATARRVLWEPICTASLNTPLDEADAALLAQTAQTVLFTPPFDAVPWFASENLTATFITPAERVLRQRGAQVHLRTPITSLKSTANHVTSFTAGHAETAVNTQDRVVLALPPWAPLIADVAPVCSQLPTSAIVNVHYDVGEQMAEPPMFRGIIGGPPHWILRRDGIVTATVSAAEAWLDQAGADIAKAWWPAVAAALGLNRDRVPTFSVIKERRATLRHTPASEQQRRRVQPQIANLRLAGDWTVSDLPNTIEAAIRSGFAAAQ